MHVQPRRNTDRGTRPSHRPTNQKKSAVQRLLHRGKLKGALNAVTNTKDASISDTDILAVWNQLRTVGGIKSWPKNGMVAIAYRVVDEMRFGHDTRVNMILALESIKRDDDANYLLKELGVSRLDL